ncbi:glutathione S-transferase 3 isoform X3 [Sylvia atricapilla]|uniref:glutathione S-transferase 3 isoform X3 n=1 Tax=Sylvia atricapilla TaxID=48155 RepID=UPI003392ED81
MSGKPKLYYFDGRGKMESIRWLLAAAGVEFEEEFLETRDQYEKLLQGESRWVPDVSAGAHGGDRWDEDGADQSHPQLHCSKVQPLWEGPEGKSFVLKDHGQDFLVGNNFSWADVHLLEAILMVEEKKADVLSGFPQLQAFKARISSIPTIKKFLEPGSQRKPVPDDKYVETVRRVLRMYYDVKAN